MPLYEYECEKCGEIEEALQKFSDKPLTTCRHCSGRLHKLISQSSFHLKGSGWYVTDYANKKPAAQSGKNASGQDGSTTSNKADASASPSGKSSSAPKKSKDNTGNP